MRYRRLGKTGLRVSAVSMGCWAFAGGGPWGEQDDADSIAAVQAALEEGINLFDTAEGYGNGRSEEVLGRALAGHRREALIATKISPNHLTAAEVPLACERSLQRLGTDYIDLYQIHWPNHSVPLAETVPALLRLVEQGKVRALGVCNMGPQDLSDYLALGRCETNQISYSLLWRACEFAIRPECLRREVGIICWGPLSEGLLTGKFASPQEVPAERANTRHFAGNRPGSYHSGPGHEVEVFAALARVRALAETIGQPMATVALAWLLHQQGVTTVLAGSRNPAQMRANARAGELALAPETVAALAQATEALKQALGPEQDVYFGPEKTRFR